MIDAQPIRVLGFAGSLRQGSYNRALLRAAQQLTPPGMTLEVADLTPLPLYNEDLSTEGFPEAVRAFREAITAADALLIATPEYNYSVPGVLKNAIDWASRPPDVPLYGKPAAIMGATPSLWGTVRAQLHLRQIFVYTNTLPLNKPEVLIAGAGAKFDEEGRLTDEQTRGFVGGLLTALADWTAQLKRA